MKSVCFPITEGDHSRDFFCCVSCNVCGVSVGLLEALTGSLWAALQAPQAPLAHPWVILG